MTPSRMGQFFLLSQSPGKTAAEVQQVNCSTGGEGDTEGLGEGTEVYSGQLACAGSRSVGQGGAGGWLSGPQAALGVCVVETRTQPQSHPRGWVGGGWGRT